MKYKKCQTRALNNIGVYFIYNLPASKFKQHFFNTLKPMVVIIDKVLAFNGQIKISQQTFICSKVAVEH